MSVCQNCGYEAEHLYCSNCGQLLNAKRISLGHLLHEVTHTFWHLEKGFLYTLKELGTNPGTMQRKYLDGLRLPYQKPFPLFAISATLCALALFLIDKNATDRAEQFYKHYYFIVQAAMLPFYALITYLLFKSPKLYYAEALVVNVYMLGFMSVFIIPINGLSFFLSPDIISILESMFMVSYNTSINLSSPGIISVLEVIFLVSYNIWTNLNFFKGKPAWWITIKSIVSIILSYELSNFASNLVMGRFM